MSIPSTVRLRFWLPALFAGSTTLLLTLVTLLQYQETSRGIRERHFSTLKERLETTSRRMELYEKSGLDSLPAVEIADFSITAEVLWVALVDDNCRVLRGSRLEWRGRAAQEVLAPFDTRQFRAVQQSRQTDIRVSPGGNRIFAYSPILLTAAPGQLRPTRIGALIVDYDLSGIIAGELRNSLAYSLLGWAAGLLLLLALGAVFHRWLTRPLEHLGWTAERFSRGDYSARAHLTGSGELARFADTFNAMAEEVQTQSGRLREKNAELERFTYTVSHDLRSPLVTIRSFAAELSKDLDSGNRERLETDVRLIAAAAGKMDGLLADLLELSRVGRIVNPPVAVELDELVREVLGLLAGPISRRNVEVVVHPGLPRVVVDRTRVGEAIQNLVENAVKYLGDQPAPRIEIGVRDDPGARVVFVRDNGGGIAPEHLERVFDPFIKLDPHTEGSGIGLALVRRIVEIHGGTVWAESAGLGQGSSFCFTLPVAPGDVSQAVQGPVAGGVHSGRSVLHLDRVRH